MNGDWSIGTSTIEMNFNDIDYMTGNESPSAELMDDLFAALDGKLSAILGGRSPFLAQTATMPQYLIGKTFFFTAGTAIYASRIPGYINAGSGVARPYNHAQFTLAQAATVLQPAYVKDVSLANPGASYLLNDVLTAAGGTLAPGGSAATMQVTQRDSATGKILALTLLTPGSYLVPPAALNQPNGGHGGGAFVSLNLFQYDVLNKVAPVVSLAWKSTQTYFTGQAVVDTDGNLYKALSQNLNLEPATHSGTWTKIFTGVAASASDVGFFEQSLAAHSVMYQAPRDAKEFRYYLQDGATTPEKHLNFALAEIIMEGVLAVNIPSSWDKYSCFRVHNLNPKPATLTFDEDYAVTLDPFQCVTVRRDWNGSGYENYRAGYNYFFKYEGGDPRSYWFFPTSGTTIGSGGRASNSMQANNLTNPACLFDWIQYFQRTPDASTIFASLNDDPTVQCDISAFYKNLFGDPSNPSTLVGDLLHHKGDIMIIRCSRQKLEPISGNPLITFDKVTFNGYATIVNDLAAKLLSVVENSSGNLVVTNVDPNNNVYLCPISTNLFKLGENLDGKWLGLILGWPNAPFNDNDSFPTNKGIPLLSTANAGGSTSVTIENAIFESEPEQAWLDNLTLASAAPQLIQQPISITATDTRTWNDIYNLINQGGFFNPTPVVVSGTPQMTLNWNTSARGLLTLPTIVDGGGGYEPGDVEQLVGGTGSPAVVSITSTNNGKVTGIALVQIGNYTSAPPNPSTTTPLYPVDRSGAGLILGGISIPLKSMSGVHKRTVADLLKLDWWGDPRLGNQNSDYVVIENRKLTLTPHGLVLTFTETDSPLPGDSSGQPGTLPTWASGKRGLPRARALRFRGHGWGFVGGGSDTETIPVGGPISVPPSAKTGMLSPRYGRFEVLGGYKGEVVSPNGKDFTTQVGKQPNTLKLLTRVKAATLGLLSTLGRFWQASNVDNASQLVAQIPGAPAPYFFQIWEFISNATNGYPPNIIAMGLLPEMYNALARAVNAATSGVPLQWQCLFFNVDGFVTNLDPKFTLSAPRVGDGALEGFLAGLPLPVFNGLGQFVSQTTNTPGGYCNYLGPRPINQFCAFDQGSLYQRLCDQLGIPMRTELDLPGGVANGTPQPLSFFQQKVFAPAVFYDLATVNVSANCTPATPGVPLNDPSGNGMDQYFGTATVSIETELLDTVAILQGRITGAHCVGTYDRANPPDMSNAGAGDFRVAQDGSGYVLSKTFETAVFTDELYFDFVQGAIGNIYVTPPDAITLQAGWPNTASYTSAMGVAEYPGSSFYNVIVGQGNLIGLFGGVNLNAFVNYYWLQIEDVQNFVTSLGFEFLWSELCTPLVLKYFENQFKQVVVGNTSGTTNWQLAQNPQDAAGIQAEIASLQTPGNALAIGASNAGFFEDREPLLRGTSIRFCAAADSKNALWKIAPVAAPTQFAVSGPIGSNGFFLPAEVLTIKSRNTVSPFFRYVSAISGVFQSGIGGSPNAVSFHNNLGNGQRPSSTQQYPQILVRYEPVFSSDREFSDFQSHYYSEGMLLDQRQTLGFNIYSSQPIAPIPVLMSGRPAWAKQKDWWGTADNAYAATDEGQIFGGYDLGANVPWLFIGPAVSRTEYVTNYFDGAGQDGLTILEADDNQRYWCCFDASAFDLTAITFASNENFGNQQQGF